ncbi:penicillin-binding protein 2 [Tistrella sp. BH-R2-4]|uniref:Penicillin-binding protein 2 n=2 Tax=Tistrella arctica TaxID=3133430 RepID=A0ABU9YQY1_9PROT
MSPQDRMPPRHDAAGQSGQAGYSGQAGQSGQAGARPRVPLPRARRVRLGVARAVKLDGNVKQALETGRNRVLFTAAFFVLAFLALSMKLIAVGVLHDGGEPRVARGAPPPQLVLDRADIVDRNGVLLASNLITASLYADPKLVFDPVDAATRLRTVLPHLNQTDLIAQLSGDRRFVWIQRGLKPEQQYQINALGIPGLYFQREQRRIYPQGRLLSHVVGFTNVDNTGRYGLEQGLDRTLRERAETGRGPLVTTIDIRVQQVMRDALRAAIAEFQAIGATGLVMDARNGEILSMVSLPDYDPNAPVDPNDPAMFNRATLGVYEMGSIFKAFTAAQALDAGVVRIDGGFDATDPIKIGRFTIRDFHPERRWLSVPEIMLYSSNIGAAKMALALGATRQQDYMRRFGFLTPARIELPEVGLPLAPHPWRDINVMTIGFGHGMAVSPLQAVGGMAALLNGGYKVPATLIKHQSGERVVRERIIDEKVSMQLRKLLISVVEAGTAKKAQVPGYLIGGKTGTAEKPGVGGYRRKALLTSFLGGFPMNDPRYVVLVTLDEPKSTPKTYGYATSGWNAAPTAGEVIRRIAPLLGVRPQAMDGAPLEGPVLPQQRETELRYAQVGDEDEVAVGDELPEVQNAAY